MAPPAQRQEEHPASLPGNCKVDTFVWGVLSWFRGSYSLRQLEFPERSRRNELGPRGKRQFIRQDNATLTEPIPAP
jgi:hypothetical protein